MNIDFHNALMKARGRILAPTKQTATEFVMPGLSRFISRAILGGLIKYASINTNALGEVFVKRYAAVA